MFSVGKKIVLRFGGRETFVRIRAARDGAWVMVDLPHGGPVAEDDVTGVAFLEGNLIDWRARAMGSLPLLDLLALTFPEEVRVTPVRKSSRIALVAPVTGRVGEETFTTVLRDLSRGGMRMSTDRDLTEGDRVRLTMWYYDQPPAEPLEAVVRRVVELPYGAEYGMALLADEGEGRQGYLSFIERLDAAREELGVLWGETPTDDDTPPHCAGVLTVDRRQFPVRIVGGRFGRYLLTEPPNIEGTPLVAPARQRLDANISFLNAGVARAFDTTLLHQFTTPTSVWAWAWPDAIRATPLRQSPRLGVFLAAPTGEGRERRLATAVDLSEGGALLMEPRNEPSNLSRVGFILTDGKVVDLMPVSVRRVFERGNARFTGVAFDRRDGEAFERLATYYRLASGADSFPAREMFSRMPVSGQRLR